MEKTRDRISELPEPILVHILSLMPLKSAIRTSILSSKWQGQWNHISITDLDFGEEFSRGKTPDEIAAIINSILQSLSTKVLDRFRLYFYPKRQFQFDFKWTNQIEKWIEFAVERGVKELDRFGYHQDGFYRLTATGELKLDRRPCNVPCCLLTCNSLTMLNLIRYNFDFPTHFDGLHSLRILYLKWVNITAGMLESVLLSCKQLEKLTLWGCDLIPIKISGPNLQLKSLTVVSTHSFNVEIFAPNLQSFHLDGYVTDCLIRNISSVVDVIFTSASMHGTLRSYDDYMRITVLPNFSHVKILTICWCRENVSHTTS